MEKQEEKAVRRIKMEKWPISFSEWYEAYSAQIDESEEKNDSSKSKKNNREGLLDKLLFRVRLLFDSFATEAKQGRASMDWIVGEKATFFLESDDAKEQFMKWRNQEQDELNALKKQYVICKQSLNEYVKAHRKEWDRLGDRWDRMDDDEVYEYLRLMIEYGGELEKLEKLAMQLKKKRDKFWNLDVTDFLKTYIFKTVSQIESDFYCMVLEGIPSRENLDKLKNDKWWVIDVKIREKILHNIELLMTEGKWNFLEEDFYLIAMKLLRPHEYILTKEAVMLFRRVSDLYSIGDSRILCFGDEEGVDNKDDCLEIEYSDILDSEMLESAKEEEGEKAKGQKILGLAENMRALSQELSIFIEENEICPDLTKEPEMIHEEYYKDWKIKKEQE